LKLRWTKHALDQFEDLQAYIAEENPVAAEAIARRIADATLMLLREPNMGRPGRVLGTREWVVRGVPYLLAYRVEDDAVEMLAVIHSKQAWPTDLEELLGGNEN